MTTYLEFYRIVHSIKQKQRQGWIDNGVTGSVDTIASHSYGATLFAWILAENENVDKIKVIKMLLIHDLIMAFVADVTPEQKQYVTKRNMEHSQTPALLAAVPKNIRSEFKSIFAEFQAEQTAEAKLAREIDKLETLMQAKMYSQQLGKDVHSTFVKGYASKIHTAVGKQILTEITGK